MSAPVQVAALAAPVATGVAAALAMRALLPLLDRLVGSVTADITPQMRAVHADVGRVRAYLRAWSVALVAAPVLAIAAGVPIVGAIVVVGLLLAPRGYARGVVRRQRARLRDQLVSGCANLANTTRAGLSFAQGLENVVGDTPEPLAFEFRRVAAEVRRGRPLADALRDVQNRVKLEPFTLFTSAVLACHERGGNMTEALDRISTSLLENQRLERKLDAETAAGQRAVRVLAVCPVAFLALFAVADPEGFAVYATAPGQVVLAAVIALDYAGVRWARSILKLDRAAK